MVFQWIPMDSNRISMDTNGYQYFAMLFQWITMALSDEYY